MSFYRSSGRLKYAVSGQKVRHLNNLGNSCNELVYIIFYVEKVLCLFPPLAQNSAGIPCVSMLVKFCLIQFRFAVIIAKMIRSFTSLFSFGIEFCSLTCHKDVIRQFLN